MPTNASAPSEQPTKWWAHSLTIWGVIVTSLTTFAPLVARAFGIDLPAQLVQELGAQVAAVLQALGGLTGIVMTIAGRIRASQPLNLSALPPSVPPFGTRNWRQE